MDGCHVERGKYYRARTSATAVRLPGKRSVLHCFQLACFRLRLDVVRIRVYSQLYRTNRCRVLDGRTTVLARTAEAPSSNIAVKAPNEQAEPEVEKLVLPHSGKEAWTMAKRRYFGTRFASDITDARVLPGSGLVGSYKR